MRGEEGEGEGMRERRGAEYKETGEDGGKGEGEGGEGEDNGDV